MCSAVKWTDMAEAASLRVAEVPGNVYFDKAFAWPEMSFLGQQNFSV
jgi:hypothetical protein